MRHEKVSQVPRNDYFQPSVKPKIIQWEQLERSMAKGDKLGQRDGDDHVCDDGGSPFEECEEDEVTPGI